jgi:hypothetical protein
MILTEKEAVEKYCHRTMTPQALRREEDLFCPARCSVSGCMAWRWLPDMKSVALASECPDCNGSKIEAGEIGFEGICSTCDGEGKIGHFERTGYCGLAGGPEAAG